MAGRPTYHVNHGDQIKMRDYMDRRVTSRTWGPPAPCKKALRLEEHASADRGRETCSPFS